MHFYTWRQKQLSQFLEMTLFEIEALVLFYLFESTCSVKSPIPLATQFIVVSPLWSVKWSVQSNNVPHLYPTRANGTTV